MRDPGGQTDARQPLARSRRGIERTGEFEGQHHVLQRGQRRQELKRLENKPEPALPQRGEPVFGKLIKRGVAERHFTRARAIEPGQKSEQRGFTGPRGTDDGDGRARIHVEADVVEDHQRRRAALDLLGELAGTNDGGRHE